MNKLIFIISIALISSISAQSGNLAGKITNEGFPLVGVNVLIVETGSGGVSDEEGNYRIVSIPVGERQIRFSAVGFKTKYIDVVIENDRTVILDVDLDLEIIEVDEVEVIDSRVQEQSDTRVSLIDLQPHEARILPGAVTDVFRTLQSLPGVLAINDFSSQLVIRGSGPDQNLIIMDDVELFNPYRLYGVVSMFNPEAVSDIKLITGGFPSNYGDRLSAVLDVKNREGTTSKVISGNVNASIVSANLVLEGKNPFNIPGSWLINSRRTYYDLIIEPFVKNSGLVEENVAFPNFFDIQSKLALGPFNGHKFVLNSIFSRDGVDLISGQKRTNPDSVAVVDMSKNDLASFAWHYSPNQKVLNKLIVSWYRNSSDASIDSELLDPSLNRDEFEDILPDTLAPYLLGFGFKSKFFLRKYTVDDKFTYFWGKKNELEFGAGIDIIQSEVDFEFEIDPELEAFFVLNPGFRIVLEDIKNVDEYSRYRTYINNKFAISKKLYLQPGFRFDYYSILEKGYLSPRISLAYALNDITTIRAVWGIYYQSPGYEKIRDQNFLFDLSSKFTKSLEAERATHYILSLERWITSEWKAKIDGYFKKFNNLIVPKIVQGTLYITEPIPGKDPKFSSGWTRPVPVQSDSVTQIPVNNSIGEAFGIELILEKKNIMGSNSLSGWISYALAYTNRRDNNFTRPFRFDQRHTINIVLNYQINNWLDLGLRFQYGSGYPLTDPIGITPRIIFEDQDGDLIPETPVIATRKNSANGEEEIIYEIDYGGETNRRQGKKPPYHRLDVRLSADADYWDLDWTFYLDVINVYNRSNVINYDYFITDDLKLDRNPNSMFPIVPTLGFIVRF